MRPAPFAAISMPARAAFARASGAVGGAIVLVFTLAACSPVVDVTAAQDAANPACAPMMVALPDAIGDAGLRKTNSQATAAWGDPSQVVLRCGVNVPGPTTDRCVSVNGVDWVIKEGDSAWTLTTFGRVPATEILLTKDQETVSSATVLADLSAAVAKIPATGNCVGQEDLKNLPSSQ